MAPSPRVQSVLAILEAHPGSTPAELAERTGIASRHLAMLLWRLEEDDIVVHEGRRWFAVPTED